MRAFNRVVSGAAVLACLSANAFAQTEHHALSGDRVAVYNLAGRLKVQAGTGSQVTVDITRGGHDAAKLRVATGDVHGFNALRVIYPDNRIIYSDMSWRGRTTMRVNSDGTFNGNSDNDDRGRDRVEIRSSGDGLEAFADIVVNVPKGQRVVVHWGVGEATAANVDGDITLNVAAARVTSSHTRGRLTLDTGSGGVEVSDAEGDVTLDTGSGGVTVNGVRGSQLLVDAGSGSMRGGDIDVASLKLDVGSGGVHLDRVKAPRTTVDAGSGSVDLAFLSAVNELAVDAGSGGVTVRLPASQGGDVDIETGSGGIDSEFPVTRSRFSRNHIRGRIGDSNARIRIQSGSGSIRFLKN